jgi:hypothetical protein
MIILINNLIFNLKSSIFLASGVDQAKN